MRSCGPTDGTPNALYSRRRVTVQPLHKKTLVATCLIISTAEMDVTAVRDSAGLMGHSWYSRRVPAAANSI